MPVKTSEQSFSTLLTVEKAVGYSNWPRTGGWGFINR